MTRIEFWGLAGLVLAVIVQGAFAKRIAWMRPVTSSRKCILWGLGAPEEK